MRFAPASSQHEFKAMKSTMLMLEMAAELVLEIFVFVFVLVFVFVFVFVFAFLFSTHGACQVPLLANFVCPSPTECCEAVSQKEFCQKTIWSRRRGGHFKRDLGQPTLICGKDPKNDNVSEKTQHIL